METVFYTTLRTTKTIQLHFDVNPNTKSIVGTERRRFVKDRW